MKNVYGQPGVKCIWKPATWSVGWLTPYLLNASLQTDKNMFMSQSIKNSMILHINNTILRQMQQAFFDKYMKVVVLLKTEQISLT